VTLLKADPARIKADPAQIEQVLDERGGQRQRLRCQGRQADRETAYVDVAEEATAPDGLKPGPIRSAVHDGYGHGMDAETQSHLFEPFFTTKSKGAKERASDCPPFTAS